MSGVQKLGDFWETLGSAEVKGGGRDAVQTASAPCDFGLNCVWRCFRLSICGWVFVCY